MGSHFLALAASALATPVEGGNQRTVAILQASPISARLVNSEPPHPDSNQVEYRVKFRINSVAHGNFERKSVVAKVLSHSKGAIGSVRSYIIIVREGSNGQRLIIKPAREIACFGEDVGVVPPDLGATITYNYSITKTPVSDCLVL